MIPDIGIGAYDAFGLTVSYISGVDVSIIYAAMSGVFLLGQILIERKNFRLTELFQLVFVFGSGFFTAIDVIFVVLIAVMTPLAELPWTVREGTLIAFLIHGPMLDILRRPARLLFGKMGVYPPYMAKTARLGYVRAPQQDRPLY